MTARRALWAIVVAAALTWIFAARVFVAFDGVRVKVTEQAIAPVTGVAHAVVSPTSQAVDLRTPFAVIVRVRNASAAADRFTIRVDGRDVCTATVRRGHAERIDCAMQSGWTPAAHHEVAVANAVTGWTIEYVEIATHDGGSNGHLSYARLVPTGSPVPVRPAIGWIVIAAVVIAAVCLVLPPAPRLRPILRIPHLVLCALIGAALAVTVVLPWVSPYTLVVSASTFWYWAALLAAPRLWFAARTTVRTLDARRAIWVPLLSVGVVVALVFGAYGRLAASELASHRGNYSGFLQISRAFFDANPLFAGRDDIRRAIVLADGGGYDAQFMYAEAFDPFLRQFRDAPATYRAVVDAAPYRYDRIGFSLIAKIVSGNAWRRYPAVMVWTILIATGICALVLALVARRAGVSPFWGVVVAIVPGFWESLQVGLPEPVAAALLLTGYFAVLHRRWLPGALAFAASLLVRETGAIFVVCIVGALFAKGRRREALGVAALSLAPFAAWRVYIGTVLFSTWGWSAFFFNPHDVGVPLGGFVDLWRAILNGQYAPGQPDLVRAGIVYPILLVFGFVLALLFAMRKPTAAAVAAVVYGLLAISLTFDSIWVHVGNGQRGTYELFIMLALASIEIVARTRPWRRVVTAFWMASGVYVFFLAFDARFLRGVLLP